MKVFCADGMIDTMITVVLEVLKTLLADKIDVSLREEALCVLHGGVSLVPSVRPDDFDLQTDQTYQFSSSFTSLSDD